MKSTKTIFAISSIRCIKPLNSSSSCSPEQVYFSKKQKQNKKKQKKSQIFIKYNDAKRKRKKKREKENFNFLGMHKDHGDLPKCMTGFLRFCSFCV